MARPSLITIHVAPVMSRLAHCGPASSLALRSQYHLTQVGPSTVLPHAVDSWAKVFGSRWGYIKTLETLYHILIHRKVTTGRAQTNRMRERNRQERGEILVQGCSEP